MNKDDNDISQWTVLGDYLGGLVGPNEKINTWEQLYSSLPALMQPAFNFDNFDGLDIDSRVIKRDNNVIYVDFGSKRWK